MNGIPSVLDNTYPSGDGEPPLSNDPDERFAFDPNFDEFGDYTQRPIQTLSILDDSLSTLTPCPTYMTNQHEIRTYQHDVSHEAPDFEKSRPYFLTEFRQPLQVQIHLEMPGILVQLGHIQCT